MTFHTKHWKNVRISVIFGVLTTAFLAGVTACGGSKSYTIPDKVCGTAIAPRLLTQLLPAGKDFTAERKILSSGTIRCLISIDGITEIEIREYPDGGDVDVMKFAKENPDRFRNPKKVTFGDDTVVSDGAVLSANSCTLQRKKVNYILEISIERLEAEESAGRRKELESFTKAYLPNGMRATGCSI